MTLQIVRDRRKHLLCLSFLFTFFFLLVPSCGATVNKSTASVTVYTKGQDNWYDLSDKSLHTFAVCDASSSYDATKYSFTTGCNSNSKHDDYLYTDTEDERNIYPVSQNFTIKASVSASSGSITKIKLEWIYGLDSVPSDSSWTNTANNPGSAACDNKGTCTFCVVGGTCDKPVIPQAALSVKSSGAQNRFHFRVTFSSSSGDSVTSGLDSALSKFHSFVICGPKCHSCGDYLPTVTPASVTAPSNFCNGLNDTNGYYTVSWKDENMMNGSKQTYYKISVRKKGTTSVQSKEANSSDTYAIIPSSWLTYGTDYEWQVTAKFEGPGCSSSDWTVTSPWSTDATNIKVPNRYPVPKMSITNGSGSNCLSAKACSQSEDLKFDAGSSTISAGNPAYSWTVDKTSYSGVSFSTKLSGAKHDVTLKVTDGDKHTCSISSSIELANAATPPATSCAKDLKVSIGDVFSPEEPCNGLNDTDGYYAISWILPKDIKQSHYKVTLKDKNGIEGFFEADSSLTTVKVPTKKINYDNSYKWQVVVTAESSDGKCPYTLTSDWSNTANKDIVVPPKYPEPEFTVTDVDPFCGSCSVDCLSNTCQTDKELTFDASASRVYTGMPSYSWVIDDNSYTGNPVKKSFSKNEIKAVLTVTDGKNHSCSTEKKITLKNPDCADKPVVSLDSINEQGDYCVGMKSFRLGWKISPANFKQQSYELRVWNVKDPSDNYYSGKKGTPTEPDNSTVAWVPIGEINWNSEYAWQVNVTLVSANGLCTYTNVSSSVSSGNLNIKTPPEYPRPVINVNSEDGTRNCLSGECIEGETLLFYGGNSFANSLAKNTSYDWIVDKNDKNKYSGIEFTKVLSGTSHEVVLKVTDNYGSYQQACTSAAKTFVTNTASYSNSKPSWTEIAPWR
jgi:hypothetical protein